MAMNPMAMMKLKGMLEGFQQRHPRVIPFLRDASGRISEGTVIEVTVTGPDGHRIASNIRVTAEDIELLQQAKELSGKM